MFLSKFGMARVASQRFLFTKHDIVVFFDPLFYICSDQKKRALKICEHLSKFQPVNSDLTPFRVFLDDVGTKTTHAQAEVCN